MIKEIKITKNKFPPIPTDFYLKNMAKMNVIVGENNVGKTQFFNAVESEYEKEMDIIYIKANDINPSDNQFKRTATTSELIKRVSKLFNNLNIDFDLTQESAIKEKLINLIKKTNENFKKFTSSKNIELLNDLENSNLKIEPIIQGLMNDFVIKELGVEGNLKLDQIGQGYQRIFIAAILKSYVDLYKEIGSKKDINKEVLILFEEPELFLHPRLKRELNKALKEISEIDENTTIIITTHDPYFLYSNLNDDNIKVYSFEKKENITELKEDPEDFGNIADEILHISLFNKVINLMKEKGKYKGNLLKKMSELSEQMKEILNDKKLEEYRDYIYIKDFKKDIKEKYTNILLPIYIRNTIHHKDINIFKPKDIEKSIKILSRILENLT